MSFKLKPDVDTMIIDRSEMHIGKVLGYTHADGRDMVKFQYWRKDSHDNPNRKITSGMLTLNMFMLGGWSVAPASALTSKQPSDIERLGRANVALGTYGICAACLTPYNFEATEPFAHCECGTTEWGNDRPKFAVVSSEVLAKFPRTKDGVTMFPGMTVYDVCGTVWTVNTLGLGFWSVSRPSTDGTIVASNVEVWTTDPRLDNP